MHAPKISFFFWNIASPSKSPHISVTYLVSLLPLSVTSVLHSLPPNFSDFASYDFLSECVCLITYLPCEEGLYVNASHGTKMTVAAEFVAAHVGERHDPNFLHRRAMEDDTCIAQFDDIQGLFLGVYDGHGGSSAAALVGQLLHRFFLEELLVNHVDDLDIHSKQVQTAFFHAYEKMDSALRVKRCLRVGATAVTCFVRRVEHVGRVLTTANCGDARAVLSRAGRPVRLSVDHRPVDEPERNRVEKAGGFVTCARVNGILNVSRAFGDHVMKSVIVSTPDVNEVVLTDMDEFAVLACDGLWDFVDEVSVINIAQDGFDRGLNVDEVAGELVREAIDRKSTDNVSVMVVQFDMDDM